MLTCKYGQNIKCWLQANGINRIGKKDDHGGYAAKNRNNVKNSRRKYIA